MAKDEQKTSPRFSLKGWDYKKWLLGNITTIEEAIKVGVPLLISVLTLDNTAGQIVLTAVGKLILDVGHFYAKEVKL